MYIPVMRGTPSLLLQCIYPTSYFILFCWGSRYSVPKGRSVLEYLVVDQVGDELDQEEYLAVSMVRLRLSMEAAHRQRRAM